MNVRIYFADDSTDVLMMQCIKKKTQIEKEILGEGFLHEELLKVFMKEMAEEEKMI